MKKVFINGYGSIGSRITSFLKDDPEITVMGIGKYSPDEKVTVAISRGLNVYVPEKKLNAFSDYNISGSIESALDECDLVIDAAPGGHGYKNKKNLYEPKNIPAIYQGGESTIGDESVSDLLFNSRANYDLALGKQHVMQGSCNVTGMGRILEPLRELYKDEVRKIAKILNVPEKIFIDSVTFEQRGLHVSGYERLVKIPHAGYYVLPMHLSLLSGLIHRPLLLRLKFFRAKKIRIKHAPYTRS